MSQPRPPFPSKRGSCLARLTEGPVPCSSVQLEPGRRTFLFGDVVIQRVARLRLRGYAAIGAELANCTVPVALVMQFARSRGHNGSSPSVVIMCKSLYPNTLNSRPPRRHFTCFFKYIMKSMRTLAGLWIDHREAVIVIVSPKGHETKRITSQVEKQLRRSGRSPSHGAFEAQMVPADDSRERDYTGHLANYYDEVISCLRPAQAIMVFGPGEAKGELRKRIERNRLDLRITGSETSDKMTERQILQKVRRHYSPVGAARPLGRGGRWSVKHDRSPIPTYV